MTTILSQDAENFAQQAIRGAHTYGLGVLRQQRKMSDLFETARSEGLLPATDIY